MLRSVRIVFEIMKLRPESIKFTKEEFDRTDNLVTALTEDPKKCPAIVTLEMNGDMFPHVMVATNALKGKEFISDEGSVAAYLKDQWFIQCKNTFRDDISEPGIAVS